jgi:hypothetical protein
MSYWVFQKAPKTSKTHHTDHESGWDKGNKNQTIRLLEFSTTGAVAGQVFVDVIQGLM